MQAKPLTDVDLVECYAILRNSGLANTPKDRMSGEQAMMFLTILQGAGVTREELVASVREIIVSEVFYPPFKVVFDGALTHRKTTTHTVGMELPDGRYRLIRVPNAMPRQQVEALMLAEYASIGVTPPDVLALPVPISEDDVRGLAGRFRRSVSRRPVDTL